MKGQLKSVPLQVGKTKLSSSYKSKEIHNFVGTKFMHFFWKWGVALKLHM